MPPFIGRGFALDVRVGGQNDLFHIRIVQTGHQFFDADVFEWLKEGHETYDLIFIDPPTFSNSKKFQGTFDVQRDHASLLKRAMNRLSNGGTLYFSNNADK